MTRLFGVNKILSNRKGSTIMKKNYRAMKGKTVRSLREMGEALGVKTEASEKTFSKKCRKCGSQMNNIAGTNVWLCPGTTEEGEPCGNRLITAVRTAV